MKCAVFWICYVVCFRPLELLRGRYFVLLFSVLGGVLCIGHVFWISLFWSPSCCCVCFFCAGPSAVSVLGEQGVGFAVTVCLFALLVLGLFNIYMRIKKKKLLVLWWMVLFLELTFLYVLFFSIKMSFCLLCFHSLLCWRFCPLSWWWLFCWRY